MQPSAMKGSISTFCCYHLQRLKILHLNQMTGSFSSSVHIWLQMPEFRLFVCPFLCLSEEDWWALKTAFSGVHRWVYWRCPGWGLRHTLREKTISSFVINFLMGRGEGNFTTFPSFHCWWYPFSFPRYKHFQWTSGLVFWLLEANYQILPFKSISELKSTIGKVTVVWVVCITKDCKNWLTFNPMIITNQLCYVTNHYHL